MISGALARRTTSPLILFLIIAPAPSLALAETPTFELEPVTVTAPRLTRDKHKTPAAMAVVDEEDLQQSRQQLQLDESLNRIPGVFFQNRYNFAQNLRLSIRGFGARAPFGIRGLRLRVDELPETLPDGQSQVDTIDLESVDRVEVIRGPSSALYGNASGGVVAAQTRMGPPEPYIQGRVSAGSYGFRRYGVLGGGETGPWNGHVSAWHMNYDGYRDQSETEKMLFNGKGRYSFSPHRDLTALFTALDQPKGQDPGGISREQVRENRRQANPNAQALGAGQTVEHQRFGLIFRDAEALPGELKVRAFYARRDFEQQLPFPGPSLIRYNRDFYGVSTEYTEAVTAWTRPLTFILGADLRVQRDDRARFLVAGDGSRGDQIQDALEIGTSAAVFGQADIVLGERLDLTLGGRFDRVMLEIEDRRGEGEASGERGFNEFSLSIGPSYQLHPDHRLYANLSTAFETPTFTEFYDPTEPDEGFDADLNPQQALNAEVGIKGFLGQRTRYELALFRIWTDDEIVQVDNAPDRFANAGETRRDGLELGVEHFLTPELSLSGAYTWSDFRFREYTDQGGINHRNNRLPGLPEHSLFAELAWRHGSGWYAMADTLLVGQVYADDANEERVAGYGVLNSRIGRRFQLADTEVEAFAAVNNLTDQHYFSNVRINSGENFLEPAPERNYYAGVRVTF